MAKVARKLNARLWAEAKAEARARMGGVHSARAMQLAVALYKRAGGRYAGPRTGAEGLSRWTAQRWTTRPGTPRRAARGGTVARYLPKAAWEALTPAEQRETDARKRRACEGRRTCIVPNAPAAARASRKARRAR